MTPPTAQASPEGPSHHDSGDRPILLSPTPPARGPPTPAGDRKVTQPPQPPPHTHTLTVLLLKKGGFPFFLSFFPSGTLTYLPVGCLVHGPLWSGPGVCGLGQEGPTIKAGCVALLCVVGKRATSGGPSWPPIILASIKLKHIAHLLHNKPQLFHGSN